MQEFILKYGSEEQCYQTLFKWRCPNGFKCPECSQDPYCVLNSGKPMQCKRRRYRISVATRTVFDSTKLPLTNLCLSFCLFTRSKDSVYAQSLKRSVGLAYTTALLIKHKIQHVVKERNNSKPISVPLVQIHHAYWAANKVTVSEAVEQLVKAPSFVAAVWNNADGHPDISVMRARLSPMPQTSKS